ncbi:hypothetical protein SASPL_100952 [Salvia splendens]|uniref:J domain-containing protein n=1 Tax=Salvia splendens TaxID=180675 RepID=A0A8X8YTX5_SALSN|nr:hypothetical protein SASPL_100952 [Salvia splendens]
MGDVSEATSSAAAAAASALNDDLLKKFFAEVSEVERDNEVSRKTTKLTAYILVVEDLSALESDKESKTAEDEPMKPRLPDLHFLVVIDLSASRILSCFKLNAFEYLNLPFTSSVEDVKRQYRKLSLLVHPDKCKHPQAKEAFGALAKAQQLLLDQQERDYILNQVNAAREELRTKRKKQLKKDTATKLKSLVDEGKYEQEYERSEEFQQQLKLKVRELLTDQEWRRRKMQMRISEEEGRLKKDEEETKEMWKRKREHEEQWEGTREKRVSSWRDFMKGGKKAKKGELRPPKLKTEDPNKSYVQRPLKRG